MCYDVLMAPPILLGLLVGIPLILVTLFRVKPLYLFVSIITGYFWVQFLGESAELMLRSFATVSHPEVVIRLILLLIPVVLTLLLMRKTLSASAIPFQFILLIGNSVLLATFMVPLLTAGTQGALYQTHVGSVFWQIHDVAIAAIAGLHLLVMFIMRPKHGDAHAHPGKKHK